LRAHPRQGPMPRRSPGPGASRSWPGRRRPTRYRQSGGALPQSGGIIQALAMKRQGGARKGCAPRHCLSQPVVTGDCPA
jgi:hypothetical protein